MNPLGALNVDDWGRVVVGCDAAIEVLMSGRDLTALYVEASPELLRFNEVCARFDKPEEMISPATTPDQSPEAYHAERSQQWLSPIEHESLWDGLLAKCQTAEERRRFVLELEEFNKRGMLPVLAQLHGMIQRLDEAGVVRGVGRGSSVASFILFLMDVHFINPMLYDLDVSEFLK